MAEDPQPRTLQERIALLNAAHVGRNPSEPAPPRPKPQPPTKRPDIIHRQYSVNNPPVTVTVSDPVAHNLPNGARTNGVHPLPPKVKAVPPPLPTRHSSQSPAPPLKRPSEQLDARASLDSNAPPDTSGVAYIAHGIGGQSSRTSSVKPEARSKATPWGAHTSLPVPFRPGEGRTSATDAASFKNVNAVADTSQPQKPSLPPRLPPRKSVEDPGVVQQRAGSTDTQEPYRPRPSALGFGMNAPTAIPNNPSTASRAQSQGPPPIPLASRPDLSKIQATKPRPPTTSSQSTETECMLCRDFSGPDNHAARFPRHSLPRDGALPYLAQQLTAPFSSLTDKARAIFTWLHYNVLYDVQSFFAGTVRPSTPASTLASGLAVCEGFAGLFTALATYAGLESMVISGHGKGFGFTAIAPGQPLPTFQGNHAWNVVKIDGEEWKLIDSCWGAGHVQGAGQPYAQKFDPNHFTMSNEEFAIKHFPSDRTQFFLPGGRIMSFEEYIAINPAYWPYTAERPTVFSKATEDHGVGSRTLLPVAKKIDCRQTTRVRFQFGLFCEHATLEKHVRKGLPFVYIVAIHGLDGRRDDFIPLEHVRGQHPGGGGDFWYADVDAQELGAPGQSVTLFAVTSFGQRKGEACRGLTVREFKEGKGRTAMGFEGVVGWELI